MAKKIKRAKNIKAKKSKPLNVSKVTRRVLGGFLVPGLPHILLMPEKNSGWMKVRRAFDEVRKQIEELKPDVLIIYSTYWPSVIGHQIQADPKPKWILVDDQFHDVGSIPYEFRMDADFAKAYEKCGREHGLHTRTVAYKGFPIDTGSVVALKLLNPDNKFPAVIVSSNIYADRAETLVLGKVAREVCEKSNKKAVGIVISSLSNRLFGLDHDPKKDQIHSLKDQEWNKKVLEFLGSGRLEDISQLSRQIHKEARVQKVNNFKPFWWLAALMGQNNRYKGHVFAYEPIWGTGAALVGLTPAMAAARDLEFDEDDPANYSGERNVLDEAGTRTRGH